MGESAEVIPVDVDGGLLLVVDDWAIWRVGAGFGVWHEVTAADDDGPAFYSLDWHEARRWAATQAGLDVWQAWITGELPARRIVGPA